MSKQMKVKQQYVMSVTKIFGQLGPFCMIETVITAKSDVVTLGIRDSASSNTFLSLRLII